jgi:hypothetical protein
LIHGDGVFSDSCLLGVKENILGLLFLTSQAILNKNYNIIDNYNDNDYDVKTLP